MDRLHFIGFAPQSDGVSVPIYAPMSEHPVCECGDGVCPEQCRCDCHYREAVKAIIKALMAQQTRILSIADLIIALRAGAIALPENVIERWQFVADMRYAADRELAREREAQG